MRHVIAGAGLLVFGLIVTFAVASVLQGLALANRTVTAEPFVIDKIRPDANANRVPRGEPAGRSAGFGRRIAGI